MNKTVIVTGATGAIGFAIAHKIASLKNWDVVLAARNTQKGEAAVEKIIKQTGNKNVKLVIADLSLKKDIDKLLKEWQGPLNVLINNAAITPIKRKENSEGIEMQWALNVLGYWRMIEGFSAILSESAKTEYSRIVNVASFWAGGLDLNDVEFKTDFTITMQHIDSPNSPIECSVLFLKNS